MAALIWIWLCVWLSCAGWGLSAIHELNPAGYAAALIPAAVLFVIWRKKTGMALFPNPRKITRRFRRGFPRAFLILAAMAFLGGVLYAPNNYDGLTYRLPRILNWLAADRWHWIHTWFPRLNGRACGIEWVSAPLLLLKTDRLLFLINFVSLLLLPGLVFSVWTRLGVRRRVAWHWMWLAPAGYGFLLQAGSIGNDLFGAPFVLAAVDFALRARISCSRRDFFASVLAAAMMTGGKTSNLPMLLPWAIAIWPALFSIRRWLLPGLAVGVVAAFASALPTLVANAYYYHGDWAGLSAEGDNRKGPVLYRTADNTVLMALQNLAPPVFPLAGTWNRAERKYMPHSLDVRLLSTFAEPEAAEFKLEEIQIEEEAGLGFGVSSLLLLSIVAARRIKKPLHFQPPPKTGEATWLAVLRWSPLISLLALLSQSEVSPLSRILVPYYCLLLPAFLTDPRQELLLARRWWRWWAGLGFLMAGLVLVITPSRPLFPADTIFSNLQARYPDSHILTRAATIYGVYHDRSEAFAPALAKLPPDVRVLGVFTYDDPGASLWKPYGQRRVVHVCPDDTAEYLKQEGIQYILIQPLKMKWFHLSPEHWVQNLNAQVTDIIPLKLRAGELAVDWWLVRLP